MLYIVLKLRGDDNMSIHDERIAKQPEINRNIYYNWLKQLKSKTNKGLDSYLSSVTRFFDYEVSTSILEIQFSAVERFISRYKHLKPSQQRNIINQLKNFLVYVENNHQTNWDFASDNLNLLIPSIKEIKDATEKAEPLLFRELYALYKHLNNLRNTDEKWKEAYIVFKLMYDHKIGKTEISNLNSNTFNSETGEFIYKDTNIKLNDELREIFKTQGLTIGYYSEDTIFGRLKLLGNLINRNITQEDIWATSELYQIPCPGCGNKVKNSINLLGAITVDILDFDGAILCKDCLENLNYE